jgi:Flp pilus assembly protein TadG
MKVPALHRFRFTQSERNSERGITMVLVAVAMVAIIAMAALSIDVVTLYLAKEEAQRSADAAALAAARVISISGITGTANPSTDTSSWAAICGTGGVATQTAQTVGKQNSVGHIAPATVTVTYSAGSGGSFGSSTDCSGLTAAFAVNPMVTVQVTRGSLPNFFSRVWGRTGNSVSATASAEAFNPSNSGNVGNGPTGTITPVQPRCVKPWVVPNRDPKSPPRSGGNYCDQGSGVGSCNALVSTTDGSIVNPGISLNGSNTNGVIGERFWLSPDCRHTGSTCTLRTPSPLGNYYPGSIQPWLEHPPSLQYLPGEAPVVVPVAVPSCASGRAYEKAIGGCDQSTVYQCGVQSPSSPNSVDMSENPGAGTNDTANGVSCLIHEGDATEEQPDGQDTLVLSSYPLQILAGSSTSLTGLAGNPGKPISSSNSIVSLPIYDDSAVTSIRPSGTTNVTIVGFLQVFINSVDQWGNVDVTVLNVAGCGSGSPGSPVTGSSPVPIRLITPP